MSEENINDFFAKYINESRSSDDVIYPQNAGNNIICPKCHRDTGISMLSGEVVYVDKRCPFCGEIIVHSMNIVC